MAVRAMRHGKDVMLDKPGATTLEQLAELRRVQAETGRILSILYSEHYTQPATVAAGELVKAGRDRPRAADDRPRAAPGRQLRAARLVLEPRADRRHPLRHRLAPGRAVPVLHRRARRRRSSASQVANFDHPETPEFEDFGADRCSRSDACDRLHPRRLVHAGRPADLGRRAALHPRHRGHDRAPEIHRHRRPAGRRSSLPRRPQGHPPHRLRRRRRSPTASSCATTC